MSKHSATGAAWQAQRKRVLSRDEWTCTACGVALVASKTRPDGATVDHCQPIVLDPDKVYRDTELVAMCRKCNGRKQDRVAARIDYVNRAWLKELPR